MLPVQLSATGSNPVGDYYGTVTSWFASAATTFLVWDMLINLDREVHYIWRGTNGWVKWMYLFIRHMPYLAQGSILAMAGEDGRVWSTAQCEGWIIYQTIVAGSLTFAVEIVLIVRVYAMYNRNRVIVALVIILFIAEVAGMCTILGLTIPKMEFSSQCLIVKAAPFYSSVWVVSLAFETTLFVLTLVKFFAALALGEIRKWSILVTLVRDGTWVYAIVFAIMLLNTVMYEVEKNALAGMFYFWEISVMSFAGSHVLLNLRQFGVRPSDSLFARTGHNHSLFDSSRDPPSDVLFRGDETETDFTVELDTMQFPVRSC